MDVLKSSLSTEDVQRGEDSFPQPPVISTRAVPSLRSGVSGEASCFAMAGNLGDRLGEVLSALPVGWNRKSELGRDTLAQFGICTGSDRSTDAGLSALSILAAVRDGDNVGPWALHLDKGTFLHLLSWYFEKIYIFFFS